MEILLNEILNKYLEKYLHKGKRMNKETLMEQIERFVPFNYQEEKDKEIIRMFINDFDNIYKRENDYAHITASCWVVNKDRTKVLMCYHKIYDSWSWTGGHADGDEDLIRVASKELEEETGLKNYKLVCDEFIGLENLTVDGHIKRGKYVSSHLHLNFTYLFEADEDEKLIKKEDENEGLKWIPVCDIDKEISPHEKWILENVYHKYIDKIKNMKG